MVRLALYQPEIPQNVGTLARTCACFEIPLDIIEPCSFIWSDQKLKRAGMDYLDLLTITKHKSWGHFIKFSHTHNQRIVLLDTQGADAIDDFKFEENDILLLGQESTGVPKDVFDVCDRKVYIPIHPQCRSLNVAITGGIVLFEALRQIKSFNVAVEML